MPRLEYFLVSESFALDQATNRISFFHVLEEAAAPAFPAQINCVAIAAWNMDPADMERDFGVTVRVRGVENEAQPGQVNFTASRERHRAIMRIHGVPLLRPGAVVLELLLNGQHQADHTITVREARPGEIGTADAPPPTPAADG